MGCRARSHPRRIGEHRGPSSVGNYFKLHRQSFWKAVSREVEQLAEPTFEKESVEPWRKLDSFHSSKGSREPLGWDFKCNSRETRQLNKELLELCFAPQAIRADREVGPVLRLVRRNRQARRRDCVSERLGQAAPQTLHSRGPEAVFESLAR